MSICIKTVLDDKIHRILLSEASFAELEKALNAMYGRSAWLIRYQDDEGDLVCVCSSDELLRALQKAEGTLKLFLSREPTCKPTEKKARRASVHDFIKEITDPSIAMARIVKEKVTGPPKITSSVLKLDNSTDSVIRDASVPSWSAADVLRPLLADIVYPLVRQLIPLVASFIGVVFCWYGSKTLFRMAWSLFLSLCDFLFTIQEGDTQFSMSFMILFGYLGLFIITWAHDVNYVLVRNLWMLAVVPLIYNCTKTFIFYVPFVAPSFDLFSLNGWMTLLKDRTLLVMFFSTLGVGDLCTPTLMLINLLSSKKSLLNPFCMSLILLISLRSTPVGLLVYISSLFLLSVKPTTALAFVALLGWLWFGVALDTPENLFYQIWPIAIGWAGLLLSLIVPKRVWEAKTLFAMGVALPTFNFTKVVLRHYQIFNMNEPKPNIFTADGWDTLVRDPYIMFGFVAHLAIVFLSTGFLILQHFNSVYSWADMRLGKLFIAFILVLTALFAPLGLFLYGLSCWLIPVTYTRGYMPPPPILDARPVHWGENLPEFPRFVFYCLKAAVGVFLAILHIFLYIIFVVCTYFISFFISPWTPASDNPTFSQFAAPNPLVPPLIRNLSGQMRVYLYSVPRARRGLLWKVFFHVLQFAAIVDIGLHVNNPNSLSASLAGQFGGVFPFADGVGIADRVKINEYLLDRKSRKGPRSLAGPVSSTQAKFSSWSTITMGLAPLFQGQKVLAARRVLVAWIREFDFNMEGSKNSTFATLACHFPPLYNGKLPSDQELYSVFGDVLYWMATPNVSPNNHSTDGPATPTNHGMMTRREKDAFSVLVNNLFQFFPDWFNFLLLGGYMERQVNSAFYSMREALYRDKGAAYQAAMKQGNVDKIPESEVLRLIASVFAIAGAAVPSKLLAAILRRIESDPINMAKLYNKDKATFVKECARLDPAVFWVNLFTNKPETINGVPIEEGTPCHLYIPFANLDPTEFGPNPLAFNPIEERVKNIFSFNGMEGMLHEYPRGCPGHDVAIRALILITDHYLPLIVKAVSAYDTAAAEHLDVITTGIVQITTMRCHNWQTAGHYSMDTFSSKDLDLRNYYGFVIPAFDEDFHNNLTSFYDFSAHCATLIPVIDHISFVDENAARSWRNRHLTHFPRTVGAYSEDPQEGNTDDIISHLAFYGLGCHRTKLCSEGGSKWKYVNDVSALGKFEVRKGYVKYGACAYFDAEFKPQAIRLCCKDAWFMATDESSSEQAKAEWEFAKWVWKVSVFTLVTINDHLLECHLIKANALAMCSRQTLSPGNLLRAVLKPFTYQSIYINQLAGRTLISPNGLAARVFAFSDVPETLRELRDGFQYQSDWLGMHDAAPSFHDFPLKSDYFQLLDIVTNYVKQTLQLLEGSERVEARNFYAALTKELRLPRDKDGSWPPEKFIHLLSELIVSGTGIHNHVGQISDVQILPNLTGAKLVESMTSEPIQSYALNTSLTSSTGVDHPMLLDDWSYLLAHNPHATLQYFKFKEQLVQMSTGIRTRKTTFPYDLFDPSLLGTSAST